MILISPLFIFDDFHLKKRSWKTIESFISWSKDGDGTLCGEELYEVSQLQHGDEDGEIFIEDEKVEN